MTKTWVLVFVRGSFARAASEQTTEAAYALCDGVYVGADLFGSTEDCSVYVMPDEESDMHANESAAEVERAMVRLAEVEERERLEKSGVEP